MSFGLVTLPPDQFVALSRQMSSSYLKKKQPFHVKEGYINVVSFFVCVTNLRSFKESSMKDRRSKTVRLQQRDLFVSLARKKGINDKSNKQSKKY